MENTINDVQKDALATLMDYLSTNGGAFPTSSGLSEPPVFARITGAAGSISFQRGVASATKLGTGHYIIDLSVTFPDEMNIIVMPESGTPVMFGIAPVSGSEIEVRSWDKTGSAADMNFRITAWPCASS